MRPASSNSTISGAAGFRNFSSPIPYLFGGLALVLALIAAALLILACSHRKYSSSASAGDEEKPAKTVDREMEVNQEPKILVIMAGESNPTYLAMPVSSTNQAEQSV